MHILLNGGVQHQDIDLFSAFVRHLFDLGFLREVPGDDGAGDLLLFRLLHRFPERIAHSDAVEDHMGARPAEQQSGRLPDSPAGTGHKRGPSGKIKHIAVHTKLLVAQWRMTSVLCSTPEASCQVRR